MLFELDKSTADHRGREPALLWRSLYVDQSCVAMSLISQARTPTLKTRHRPRLKSRMIVHLGRRLGAVTR